MDMVLLHEEEEPLGKQQDAEAPHSLEPQKAHLIGELVVVA